MDQIILKLTPYEEEIIRKPFVSTDRPKECARKIMRAYNEAKMFKEYHNTTQCLYWIGELQFELKMRR